MASDLKNIAFRFYLRHFFSPQFSAGKSLADQQKVFSKLMRELASTQLGQDLKLDEIKTYTDYNRIPITQYNFYEPYIEKIKSGQQKVMTAGKVKYFGKTAGTTSGKSKLIHHQQHACSGYFFQSLAFAFFR